MPDYNLGRAHGTVEIDYDGKGAKQAKGDIDDIGKKSDSTSKRIKASSESIQNDYSAMAAAVRQLQNDVNRSVVAELAAKARLEAAEEQLAQTRAKSAASAKDLKDAERQVTEAHQRVIASSARVRSSQQSLLAMQNRLAHAPRINVTPEVDRGQFNQIVSHLRNIEKTSKQSVLGLNTFSNRLRLMVGGIALASPAAAGLAVSLVSLAGAAGVAAAAIASVGAVAGTLATAFSGIGEAFKQSNKAISGGGAAAGQAAQQQRAAARQITQAIRSVRDAQEQLDRAREDAARVAEQTARDIISAERSLRDAQFDALRAQQQLTRAREEATRQLEDLRSALTGGALDERQAIIDVQRAQEELNKVLHDPRSSALDREQAILNLEKEQHALEQVRAENQRLAQDEGEAAAAGVDGSDAVVSAQQDVLHTTEQVGDAHRDLALAVIDGARQQEDAQRAIRDATEALSEAQLDLEDAYANAADAGAAGGAAVADAMANISPEARKLVQAILAQKDAWQQVKFAVQDALFAGLSEEVKPLADKWLPLLERGLVGIADALNSVARDNIQFLKSAEATKDVQTILANTRQAVIGLGPSVRNLVEIFFDLAAVGSEFLPKLADKITGITERIRQTTQAARESGGLRQWMQDGIDTGSKLVELMGNLGSIIGTVFSAFDQEGGGALNTLVELTGRLDEFLNSAEGQSALHALGGALAAIAHLITDVFIAALKAIAPAFTVISPLIQDFAEIAGKELVAMLQILSPILLGVAKVFEFLGPVLVPLIASMFALNKAVGLAAVAWRVLNAVLRLNPFILIASLVIALAFLIIDNWETIKTTLIAIWEAIKVAAEATWNWIHDHIVQPIDEARAAVLVAISDLGNKLAALWNGFLQTAHDVWDHIKSAVIDPVEKAVETVARLFFDIKNRVKDALFSLPGELFNIGRDIMMGLWNGIQSLANWVWDRIRDIGKGIADAFSAVLSIFSPSKVFEKFGEFTMQGYIVGMDNLEADVLGRVIEIAAQITDSGQPQQPTVPTVPAPRGADNLAPPAGSTIVIDNLTLNVAGNLDPTNPVKFRQTIVGIKKAIETVEKEAR